MILKDKIVAAITAELERQARSGEAADGKGIDIAALADAVIRDAALGADHPISEGMTPDQLNATNDE